MSDVRAVLFDFGNTLFAHESLSATIAGCLRRVDEDRGDGWAEELAERIEAAAHTAEERSHPRDLDDRVWRERWHVLYGLADDEVAGLGAAVFESMHDPQEWRPYAGTASTLRRIHSVGLPIGVVSNTGWDVRVVFAAHQLEHLVDAFVLSYEVGCVKPAVGIFHRACTALGVSPGEALMVGDDPVTDAGAVRAGLRTLLLPALPPGSSNGVEAVVRVVAGE